MAADHSLSETERWDRHSNSCRVCGKGPPPSHSVYGGKEAELLERAAAAGATMRNPESAAAHVPCVEAVKRWMLAKGLEV